MGKAVRTQLSMYCLMYSCLFFSIFLLTLLSSFCFSPFLLVFLSSLGELATSVASRGEQAGSSLLTVNEGLELSLVQWSYQQKSHDDFLS